MQSTLQDLIGRMTAQQAVTDSNQSESWLAHREAERLSDNLLQDELDAFLRRSKSKDERRAAYFILGAIGANTGSVRCAQLLLERVAAEKDKYVLSTLLEALSKIRKPDDLSLSSVFSLLSDPRWLVRHCAIKSLMKSSSPVVEEQVLAHLARTTDADDIVYCHSTLNDIGTLRSIPQITLSLSSRKRDVKMSAQEAIRAIHSRHGLSPQSAA